MRYLEYFIGFQKNLHLEITLARVLEAIENALLLITVHYARKK